MDAEWMLLNEFAGAHPADAARLIEELPSGEGAALLAEVPAKTGAAVLGRMAPSAGVECLARMASGRAGAIAGELPVDIASNMLRRLEAPLRESVLAEVPRNRQGSIRLLLRYPEGTAGAVMDPLVQAFAEDITVEEAIRLIQRTPDNVYYYLYVLDRAQVLAGVLDIRELMLAPRDEPLGSVMHRSVKKLAAGEDLRAVLVHPGWRDFDALPVVDESGVFVGAIRHTLLRRIESELAVGRTDRGGELPTLLALGELYWTGLWQMLQGLGSAAALEPGRHLEQSEKNHD